MAEPKIYYKCDPDKHATCNKEYCFINGGPCSETCHVEYALQPVEKVRMILPVTHDQAVSAGLMEEKDVRE